MPENLVSVSKIRQELENGRRLNTAMRNNHVDLEALDNILKSVTETGRRTRNFLFNFIYLFIYDATTFYYFSLKIIIIFLSFSIFKKNTKIY